MCPFKLLKLVLVAVWMLGIVLWAATGSLSQSNKQANKANAAPTIDPQTADQYVGSETCRACHEDQFNNFAKTAHSKLEKEPSWKNKVQGCESCHGPGRAHVESDGDKTKIRTFQGEAPKQISESCLACHSGKEEHNNFRRGEHWRNDVGCTDCHSPHGAPTGRQTAESNVFVSAANAEKPGYSTVKLLRESEPQLCLQCHSETRHQFNQPFHHKVLEGAMRCSDCHNPHGGFETKQTRLATGADAACVKCHADKQGPFVFEHAPVKTEGCASCHTPHGSSNPRLLRTSRVSQLCLECHSNAHGVGADEPAGPQHNLNAQYNDCTACHVRIHGSHTSPVFFR